MRRLTCHICLGFCWLLFARVISAQPQEVRFEFLTIEHGLSNFSINDIIQDGQGFLWFATEDGLNKYDGYNFKIYKAVPDDGAALPHSYVIQLGVTEKPINVRFDRFGVIYVLILWLLYYDIFAAARMMLRLKSAI